MMRVISNIPSIERDRIPNHYCWIVVKDYAEKRSGLHWGFVRGKDAALYINNTEFVLEMSNDHWKPLEDVFGESQVRQLRLEVIK